MATTKNSMNSEQVTVLNGKEKDDLREPLPAEWTSAQDLGEVTLYSRPFSPPCCKLRMIFSWYKVNFKLIQGNKKDSDYKKIPVVIVQNRQINDSFVVVKSVARILDGKELTKELIELEEMNTYGLMLALELAVLQSWPRLCACAPSLGGFPCCLMTCCGCLIMAMGPPRIKQQNPNLQSLAQYNQSFTAALGSKQFFHGENPGIIDVSICGVLAPFIKGNNSVVVSSFLGTSGPLLDWHTRMASRLPNIF